ncbi:MAG: hypothetical protein ABI129_06465 [Rhodanobacter sp.]
MKTVPMTSRIPFDMAAAVSMLAVMPARSVPITPAGRVNAQSNQQAEAGKADEAYRWRMHAGDARAKPGFRADACCATPATREPRR